MKTIKYIFIVLLFVPLLFSCDEVTEEDEEPEQTSHLITFQNFTDITGCGELGGDTVTFIISYRDIQVDIEIEAGNEAYLNVLVEDGESINVKVQKTSDDLLLADANVSVRTESRPEEMEELIRVVTYCQAFDLIFENF